MSARALSWLVFVPLMTLIVAGSIVIVICLYLPFVALKAVFQITLGKSRAKLLRTTRTAPDTSTLHVG